MDQQGVQIPLFGDRYALEPVAYALVDDDSWLLPEVQATRWYLFKTNGKQYARAAVSDGHGTTKNETLHRFVCGLAFPDQSQVTAQVRFRSKNTLDCRKANLRVVQIRPLAEKVKAKRRARHEITLTEAVKSGHESIYWDPNAYFLKNGQLGGWFARLSTESGYWFRTEAFQTENQALQARDLLADWLKSDQWAHLDPESLSQSPRSPILVPNLALPTQLLGLDVQSGMEAADDGRVTAHCA